MMLKGKIHIVVWSSESNIMYSVTIIYYIITYKTRSSCHLGMQG